MTGTKGADNKPFVYASQHGGDDVTCKPSIAILDRPAYIFHGFNKNTQSSFKEAQNGFLIFSTYCLMADQYNHKF